MQIFFTGLSATFWAAYDVTEPFWNQLAMRKPSSTELEKDGWPGKIPTFRKWLGSKVVNNVAGRSYTLENFPWELTQGVDKHKIADDTYGVYAPFIAMMGMQSRKWPDYMIADVLRLNLRQTYDGKSLFADDHPVDVDVPAGDTFDNNLGLALSPDNFQTARKTMMTFVGEDKRALGLRPNILCGGPSLEIVILNILNAAIIAPQTVGGNTQVGANTNVLQGIAQALIIAELESLAPDIFGEAPDGLGSGDPDPAKTWFIFDTRKPIKPLLFQEREAPVFIPRINPADPSVFDKREFLYGVEARGNVGCSLPWLSLRSVGGTLS